MIRPEKETPIEISVMLTYHWMIIEKPLSIKKNNCKLQEKLVTKLEREEPMKISALLTSH